MGDKVGGYLLHAGPVAPQHMQGHPLGEGVGAAGLVTKGARQHRVSGFEVGLGSKPDRAGPSSTSVQQLGHFSRVKDCSSTSGPNAGGIGWRLGLRFHHARGPMGQAGGGRCLCPQVAKS